MPRAGAVVKPAPDKIAEKKRLCPFVYGRIVYKAGGEWYII